MKTSVLLLCLALTACQGAVGSGTVVTSTREVPAFRRLELASGINVVARTGTRSLTIRTDDNLQPLVETFVRNETLVVRVKPGTLLAPVQIDAELSNDLFEGVDLSGGSHLTMPATPLGTYAVSASGGSRLDLTGLSSTELVLDVSGGSDVTISGAATTGRVTASGGSTLVLRELPLESLQLDVSGGSSLGARVSSMLTGSASGGSTVTIVGNPSSQVDRSGGSQVSFGAP